MQSRLVNMGLCDLAKNYLLGNINLIGVDADFSSAGAKSRAGLAEELLAMFF